MGWGGDVDDVYIRICNQLAVVRVHSQFLSGQLLACLQMVFVYVADGDKTGACIAVMSTTHASYSDNPFGELIARGCISGATQYMSRDNGQSGHPCKCFQKVPSLHKFKV